MGDWRERAYPVQVRIYANDGTWALYSRHRDWGETARRAYVEAKNAHPTQRVEMTDSAGPVFARRPRIPGRDGK